MRYTYCNMKPNLFRSVSAAFAQSFPLLPRIRRSFLGMMLFSLLFIVIGFSNSDLITIPVKPFAKDSVERKTKAFYGKAVVYYSHELTIQHPDPFERILLTDPADGIDLVSLFFLFVISLIIVLVIPKLQQNNLFRRDISDALRWLGYLIMAHALLVMYRDIVLIPEIVEGRTDRAFTSIHSFPILMIVESNFALVLLAFASIYKRGVKLQEEQDLTV